MFDEEMDPDALGPEGLGGLALWQRIKWWGWLAISLVVLGLAAMLIVSVRRRREIEGLSVAERVYEDLVQWVRRLFRIEPLAHQTPHEYAGIVGRQVPAGRQAVDRIAGLYVEERFSDRPVAGAQAEVAWQEAWPTLWRRWLGRGADRLKHFWWKFFPPRQPLDLE
jgi:hypothetical protein